MSIICGVPLLECVYCLACARWAWKRCLRSAGHDSETWGLASADEFEPAPRLCRYILAVYEDDLEHPLYAPPGGYGMNPHWVVRRKIYKDTCGRVPPYLIYLDHDHEDVVLAIRGLNLARESDYAVLLDNRLGKRKFDGGYVHNGLLRAAGWVLDSECDVLKELMEKYPSYTLTFAGHSLGSGVAAMLAMVVVQNRDKLGNVERRRIRCYAIAPARCMSLNLAVRYADVINSVVLQALAFQLLDRDFVMLMICNRWGRYPPVVRTAVPVDGRFEHIVLSCNATSDHAILWIQKEAQRALDLMLEKEKIMEIPPKQRMERKETLKREHGEEHRAALRRAVTLSIPDAYSPSAYGTFDENSTGAWEGSTTSSDSRQKMSWDELIERLFEKNEAGHMVLRRSTITDGS
ncbi:Sn1-specific diacylglycerol lipase alpha [Cocos nucifera]|uniref:Sn1-specific diacylglycerol lipase alpha n=1 Tax=Cocos nucifera TaxID=13894 RepID=A0A8K0IKF1_COCNU|nr:Sn1-specific diacylglycerol lipase alpha [Cocos nucifera]